MSQLDIDQIIQELMKMHKHLSPKDAEASSAFVLARLLPHMDKEAWEKLCDKAPSLGWCALEIDDNIPTIQAPTTAKLDTELGEGLLKAAFMQHLELEVERSLRMNAPIALVHLTQSTQDESSKKTLKDTTYILQKAVHKCGGACDIVGAIGNDQLALILPGAKTFKAQNLVEDILIFCKTEGLSLKAGIAHGFGKDYNCHTLFEQADLALQEAQRSEQNTKVYQKSGANIDATLVQSHEKRFLFGGS